MKKEILNFLENNDRINYFHYLYRNNGAIMERKEFILDMLLQYLLEAGIVYILLDIKSPLFKQIEKIVNQRQCVSEKIMMMKKNLFITDLDTYNSAIDTIKQFYFELDPMVFEYLEHLANESDNLLVTKIRKCMVYLQEELETLNYTLVRRRNIS